MTGAKDFASCSRFIVTDFLLPLTLTPGTVGREHTAIGIMLQFVLCQGQEPLEGHFSRRQLWILLGVSGRLCGTLLPKMRHEVLSMALGQ